MWRVEEHRRVDKQASALPKDILKRYEKWKDIAMLSGPPGLRLIKGFHDEALLGHLAGTHQTLSLSAVADPVAWAMQLLQLTGAHPGAPAGSPSRRDVQRAFRDQLRAAHPDHGAADADAASRIADLSEARRILLG